MLAGLWCFGNPGTTFLSIAFLLGMVMVFAGLCGILAYILRRKSGARSWQLSEGIITSILGVLVLSNQLVNDAYIPQFFGMWVIFSGTSRFVAGLRLKEDGGKGWYYSMGFGVLNLVIGILSFVGELSVGLTMVPFIGVFFILQGINVLASGVLLGVLVKPNIKP